MSGKTGSSWGARSVECEHCGKLVFCSDAGRYAKHTLPAGMARRATNPKGLSPKDAAAQRERLFAKVFGI